MRGHIAKKGNYYYIVIETKNEKGRRVRKWISNEDKQGWKRKKDAQQALPSIMDQFIKGTYVDLTDDTFKEVMVKWLEDKKTAVRYNTWKSYDWLVTKHIIPHLGEKKVSALKARDLHYFYHITLLKDSKLSPASIRKTHVIILDALKRLVMWGELSQNVASGVELPQRKKAKFEVWDEKQLELFLEAAREDQYFEAFELAASTGMRQSEILAVERTSVDLYIRMLSVRQAYTLDEVGHSIDDTKNESSERSIALFDSTVEVLEALFKKIEHEISTNPSYKDSGLIIQTSVGTPLGPRNLSRNFYRIIKRVQDQQNALKEAGEPYTPFPKIRFHDLRHTHATILLKKGVHPKIVQERLGHSSITVTMDTYSHVLPNMQRAVLNSIGRSITGNKSK
ncbi:Transposase [compost metagenome]